MELLTDGSKNKKLLKSTHTGEKILAWSLPAIKTCPCAGACKAGCYGLAGYPIMPSVKAHAEYCYEMSLKDNFVAIMDGELAKWDYVKKLLVRLHVTGDFYNLAYLMKWVVIAQHNPNVTFYAYTKSVSLVKSVRDIIPKNLIIAYSFGGTEDNLIDKDKDRHVIVVKELDDDKGVWVDDEKYYNGTNDDHAILEHKRVALKYHGTKKYDKTNWGKVRI